MTNSNTTLITGTNRGIGLEFVKQYAAEGWRVFACCRNAKAAMDLQKLAQKFPGIKIFEMDVTNAAQIQAVSDQLKSETIDLLINNAGVYGDEHQLFGKISMETMQQVFLTNAVAPLIISEAFIEQIAGSKLKMIVTITSNMGSIQENSSTDAYAYCASKAAVNMIMKIASNDLQSRDVHVLLLHPGWVKTEMGGPDAPQDVQSSVAKMRDVIANNSKTTGKFLSYLGQEKPW